MGMELQNENSATARNKIQTNHDEDIETEIRKQITIEHHAEKGSKLAQDGWMRAGWPKRSENPEKRPFSLPCISHNVHYTKLIRSKNQTLHSLPAAAVRKNSEGH